MHTMYRPLPRTAALGACATLVAALLAGCASGPPRPGGGAPAPKPVSPAPGRDGPEANPPPDLDKVPDAEPRVEPVRPGGPNKPYEQFGKQYVPLAGDPPWTEKGLASWYGRKFHGRPTASGEVYNMYAMTAAHPTLPIPSYVRVRNPANGREVIVRVNDRGPFHAGRIIDLSYTAALKLGVLAGVRPVEIERITHEQIRAGSWRRGDEPDTAVAMANNDAGVPVPATPTPLPRKRLAPAAPPAEAHSPPAVEVPPVAVVSTAAPPPAQPAAASSHIAAGPAAVALPVPADAGPAPEPALASETARAYTTEAKGFWVQLGAFRQAAGAVDLQKQVERELEGLQPLLAIFNDRQLHRLQAGPYRSRSEALSAAERLRSVLKLVPVIVERR